MLEGNTFPQSKCQDLNEKSELIFRKFRECSCVPRLPFSTLQLLAGEKNAVIAKTETFSHIQLVTSIFDVGSDSEVRDQVIPGLDLHSTANPGTALHVSISECLFPSGFAVVFVV